MTHPVNTDEFHKQLTAYWSGAVDNHETRNRVADWLRDRTESRSAPKVDAVTHPVDDREFRQLLAGYLYAALASEPQAAEVLCDWLRTRTDPKPEDTPMDDAEILECAIRRGECHPIGTTARILADEVRRLRALLPATPDPEPQPCPVCRRQSILHVGMPGGAWVACNGGCKSRGPTCSTAPEAVAAWNLIRVEKDKEGE